MKHSANSPQKPHTLESLFSYALWYTGKYRVSRARLAGKLAEKTNNSSDVDQVLEEIKPYHSDTTEIRSLIEQAVSLSKPLRNLRMQLRQKGFLQEDITVGLAEFESSFQDLSNYSIKIRKRVSDMGERGYGPQYIRGDLLQKYPQFHSEIVNICAEISTEDTLRQYFDDRKECE